MSGKQVDKVDFEISEGSGVTRVVETITRAAVYMPLPGQPGAQFFDGNEVNQFLNAWEYVAKRCGLTQQDLGYF